MPMRGGGGASGGKPGGGSKSRGDGGGGGGGVLHDGLGLQGLMNSLLSPASDAASGV